MKTLAFLLCALSCVSAAYGGGCKRILKVATSITLVGHTAGRLMLMPQRPLASAPGIEVVGSLISSRHLAETMARNLANFDSTMEDLGFEKPTLTKIVVSDRTLLPNFVGPIHFDSQVSNLWHASKPDDTILMQPVLYSRRLVTDPLALIHKRAHSILKSHYRQDSYATSNKPIQEGLANFLVAHHTGEARLDFEMRAQDISQAPDLPLSTSDDPDKSGNAFSYVLWKLRGHIGTQRTASLFKAFTDNLNYYQESFTGRNYANLDKALKAEYGYFMAVLQKTLREEGQPDGFIDEATRDLGLDSASIDAIAGSLTKSVEEFRALGSGDRIPPVFAHTLGSAALAVEGYLLYALFF